MLLAGNTAWPTAAISFVMVSHGAFKQGCIDKERLSGKRVMFQAQLKYEM